MVTDRQYFENIAGPKRYLQLESIGTDDKSYNRAQSKLQFLLDGQQASRQLIYRDPKDLGDSGTPDGLPRH